MNYKCPECGGQLRDTNLKGQFFPWKDFPQVVLLSDFFAPQCEHCREIIFKGSQLRSLDEALEASVRERMASNIAALKEKFSETQKDMARKIGVSKEYFSELVSQRKSASLVLFNLFKVLSVFPSAYHCLDSFSGEFADGYIGPKSLRDRFKYVSDAQLSKLPVSSPLKRFGFRK